MNNYKFLLIQIFLVSFALSKEITIGADVVSRYVWRGTDYGNAAAVQPTIEGQIGPISLGAWGSWSISPGPKDVSGNECDLYASTSFGPLNFILTDYFFPTYSGKDALFDSDRHVLELGIGTDAGPISLFAASNISGDDDNSAYVEINYEMFSIGFGNGSYTNKGEFAPVSIGISGTRDNYFASYIINPDQETSFLVFGINF